MIEANQQTEPTVEKQSNTEGPQVLKVSQILMDLDSGLGRPQIKEKYSLTATELKALFQHPTLKKRRPKLALNKSSFTRVDDVSEQDDTQRRVDVEAQKVEDNTSENDNEQFDTFEIID